MAAVTTMDPNKLDRNNAVRWIEDALDCHILGTADVDFIQSGAALSKIKESLTFIYSWPKYRLTVSYHLDEALDLNSMTVNGGAPQKHEEATFIDLLEWFEEEGYIHFNAE